MFVIRVIIKKCSGWGMWLVGEPREVHTEFWWRNLRERSNFEGLGIDGS